MSVPSRYCLGAEEPRVDDHADDLRKRGCFKDGYIDGYIRWTRIPSTNYSSTRLRAEPVRPESCEGDPMLVLPLQQINTKCRTKQKYRYDEYFPLSRLSRLVLHMRKNIIQHDRPTRLTCHTTSWPCLGPPLAGHRRALQSARSKVHLGTPP